MARPPRWNGGETLAECTGIPALPMESPRGVDDPWLHGAVDCLARADLVLLVGKNWISPSNLGNHLSFPGFAASRRSTRTRSSCADLLGQKPL